MEQWFEHFAGVLYFGLLTGGFAVLVLAESIFPRRAPGVGLGGRWLSNISLFLLNTALLRLLQPIAAAGAALYVAERHWGLFHFLDVPLALSVALSVVLLDFGRYVEHFAMHRYRCLWRFHKVHHTDIDFDCTTGLRFHPLEAVTGVAVDLALVAMFGIPATAVWLIALLHIAISLFNHANVRLPLRLERALRLVIVTPDMHRAHHSVERQETDSNYAALFSFWDRLFGTYCAQPRAGHNAMHIGLADYRDPRRLYVHSLLWMPFAAGRAPVSDEAARSEPGMPAPDRGASSVLPADPQS